MKSCKNCGVGSDWSGGHIDDLCDRCRGNLIPYVPIDVNQEVVSRIVPKALQEKVRKLIANWKEEGPSA